MHIFVHSREKQPNLPVGCPPCRWRTACQSLLFSAFEPAFWSCHSPPNYHVHIWLTRSPSELLNSVEESARNSLKIGLVSLDPIAHWEGTLGNVSLPTLRKTEVKLLNIKILHENVLNFSKAILFSMGRVNCFCTFWYNVDTTYINIVH